MKRVAVASVLLSGLCALLPMSKSFAQHVAGDQIEPKARSWKTWVIPSGREFRVAPPPNDAATVAEINELKSLASKRDAAVIDVIAYWNVGPPSYRWHEIALSETMRNNLSWNFAMRHFALLHVAIYDALVACRFRKFDPAWIRVVRQNHRIIRADACNPALARNVRRRLVQAAMSA